MPQSIILFWKSVQKEGTDPRGKGGRKKKRKPLTVFGERL
jgi:hypothetical protein